MEQEYCCCCGRLGATHVCSDTRALPYCSHLCEQEANELGLHSDAKEAILRAEQSFRITSPQINSPEGQIRFNASRGEIQTLATLSSLVPIIKRYANQLQLNDQQVQDIDMDVQTHIGTLGEQLNTPHLITLHLLAEQAPLARDQLHDELQSQQYILNDNRILIVDNEDYRDVRALQHEAHTAINDSMSNSTGIRPQYRRYALHIRRPRYWWTPPPAPVAGLTNVVAWTQHYNAYWPWMRYWSYDSATNTYSKTERWYIEYYV